MVHGERVVDETPHIRLSLADVELPDGVRFTQYVFKMRRCAITAVLDDRGEWLLLLRRHRFVVDRWVWELPGGYVDDGEESSAAAEREVEEETGWRPRNTEYVLSCQPVIGNADYPQDLYVAHGAEHVREPEADETAEVRWVRLEEIPPMITRSGTARVSHLDGRDDRRPMDRHGAEALAVEVFGPQRVERALPGQGVEWTRGPG